MLALAGVGSVLMCFAVGGFVWWKRKNLQQKRVLAKNCHHSLTVTSASALLAGDASYRNSWVCDGCDAASSDLQASFYRCNTCKIDICQKCYASRAGHTTCVGQHVGAAAPQPLISVTVPEGMGPGSLLQAQTPEGVLVQVTIPEGVSAGQVLQVQAPTESKQTAPGVATLGS